MNYIYLVFNTQGDVIKEGQTVGFLDQFGTEFPVKVSLQIFIFIFKILFYFNVHLMIFIFSKLLY